MEIPASTFGIAALIALAIPSLTFATIRTALTGGRLGDKDLADRGSQAIAVSVLLDALYQEFHEIPTC